MSILFKGVYFRISSSYMGIGKRILHHDEHLVGNDEETLKLALDRTSIELALAGIEVASALDARDDVEKYVQFLNKFTHTTYGGGEPLGNIFNSYRQGACTSFYNPSLHHQCTYALDKLAPDLKRLWGNEPPAV